MKLIVVGNHFNAHAVFKDLFSKVIMLNSSDYLSVEDTEFPKDSVVLFGGGADISTALYNQKPSSYTHSTDRLSVRDVVEKHAFNKAKNLGIPMIGICRGAQLICALSGGSLYQHVDNHGTSHPMTTNEGEVMVVSSVHHQMMNPEKTNHELIGWSESIRSKVHIVEGDVNVKVEVEPEIIYFKDTKGLAIQFHPEFMSENSRAVEYSKQLVQKLLISN